MAICQSTRRVTKSECSSVFSKALWKRWTWILALCYWMSVEGVDGQQCLSVDMTVATYPPGDINIPYGEPLDIYCTTDDYNATDLRFEINGKTIESTIVNQTTIRHYQRHPDIDIKTYYCVNTATRKKCINRVLIDTPPRNVTDFKCISNDLNTLNCTWTSQKALSNIKYNLSFGINSQLECKVDRIMDTRFCFLSTTTKPRYRQTLAVYNFNLTSCSVFGCNQQFINVDHYAIVKPKQLPVKANVTGPHSVLLTWSLSNNLVEYLRCGVDHKIQYQIAKIDNPQQFRQINATWLPQLNKTYKYELALPYAFMNYEVRVYVKSKHASDDMWSDFSFVVFKTDSERPHRPPGMPAGAFQIKPFTNSIRHEVFIIYWKQLEEYEECGDHFTYEVTVIHQNKTQVLNPQLNTSLSYVELPRTTTQAIDVYVRSKNSEGLSVNSSHLYIPSQAQILEGSTSFTKLAYANGTYELSWDINIKDLYKIDNYTLFWCRHNWTQVCQGRMNYSVLEPHKKNHIIDLRSDLRYQFAISVNSGAKSTGMVWAKCDISRDAANYDIPVRLKHEKPVNSSVEIKWEMECTLRDGIIIGYRINYCAIFKTKDECDNTVGNKTIDIFNSTARSVNITDLLYHKTYKFGFVLVTANGPIRIKYATTFLTTPEGIPSSPVNITVSNITHDSVVISYDPPVMKNGYIVKYAIYNYGEIFYNDTMSIPNESESSRRRYVKLDKLNGYTNYSWTVLACNSYCSLNTTEPIVMRTSIGPPGKVGEVYTSHNSDTLEWTPLSERDIGGHPETMIYQVQKVKNDVPQIYETPANTFSIAGPCEGIIKYRVRAVNFDDDPTHGAWSDSDNVVLPTRNENETIEKIAYAGKWSSNYTMDCRTSPTASTILPFLFLFIFLIGMAFGFIKLYKKHRSMKDIKPRLPEGLTVSEPEITNNKYSFSGWNPVRKNDKPSEEKSLLHYSKPILPSPEIKLKDENTGSSDHTDSTILSNLSRGPVEREVSTSDEGSDCSLDVEPVKSNEIMHSLDDGDTCSEAPSTPEQSAFFADLNFMKNPVVNPATGYVTTTLMSQPTTSSYVMAGLDQPIFTTGGVLPTSPQRPTLSPSGYVRQEDMQSDSFMNFPKLGISPTKPFDCDSLPTIVSLPPSKHDAGSFQLQNLDTLSSVKAAVRRVQAAPVKTSPGYVSPDSVVVTKHLNILSAGHQGADDPAILDPSVMSPDAYCRFSWNVNPANDNLNSLHADSPTNQSPNH